MALSSITGGTIPSLPVSESVAKTETIQVVEENKKEKIEKATSTEAYVRNYFSDVPILSEVARCESSFRQTNKDGEIIRGKVNSKDVGVMQINEAYHLERATRLGYNIHTIEGNLAYARRLYEEEGTQPWKASSKCWKNSLPNGVELARK